MVFRIYNSLFMAYFFLFIIGTAIGSFLNVLIDRLPKGQKITGRSHCDYCQRNLSSLELIPLFSFLLQKGKSRCCHKKLSIQYLIVELLTGLIFVIVWMCFYRSPLLWENSTDLLFSSKAIPAIYLGIFSCLIVIFVADLKYQIIPDSMQTALLILVLALKLVQFIPLNLYPNIFLASITVMLPILIIYLITWGCSMGFGDVKLAFIMGILLGIKGGLIALYLAFVTGGVVGLILIFLKRKKLKSKIAFGPFLVIGTVVVLFWGEKIIEVINKLYGL